MQRAGICLLAAAIFLFCTSCRRDIPPQPPAFSEKQTLIVYTSHSEEVYAPVIKEFKERTGIWVTVETGESNALMERLVSENASPVCDIMFGGDLVSHMAYRDCFEPYQSSEAAYLNAAYIAPDSHSTPFSVVPVVFVYNPKTVRQRDVPDSWEALLDPRLSRRIAFAGPAHSIIGYSALAAMVHAAEQRPDAVLESFAFNVGTVQLESQADVTSRVIDGSYLVGIASESTAALQARAGLDVAMLYPSDGTSLLLDCTAIVKGAPNPEAAKQFVDFTISRDIQNMIAADLSRRPVRSGAEAPKWLTPATDIPAPEDISRWSVENRNAILTQWAKLTGLE